MILQDKAALRQQFLVALSTGIGYIGLGQIMGYTSSAIPSLREANSTLPITEEEASWIGSMVPVGAICGSLIVGSLLSLLGRRNFFLVVIAPVMALGWILIATAVDVYMIYAGRFWGGFCYGVGVVATPMYIVETADVKSRGKFGVASIVFGSSGILLVYICGALMDWVWTAWTGFMVVIPFAGLLLITQESPLWLVSKGRKDEALRALKVLRGSEDIATAELRIITQNHEDAQSVGLATTLRQLPVLKAFGIAAVVVGFQHLTGFPVVLFYTVEIFEESGAGIDSHLATIIVGLVCVFGNLIAMSLIERLGRRVLIVTSAAISALANAAMGVYFYLLSCDKADNLGWLPLASMMVFIIGFQFGIGPVPFLLSAELIPSHVRSVLNPITVTVNCMGTFVIAKSYIYLKMYIDAYGAFWLYAAFCMTLLVFTLTFVPETKGKSEEEIKKHFEKTK